MTRNILAVLAGATALCGSLPAYAQTAATPTEAADDTARSGSAIEDIVVTANRRAERLQDVPIAVSAISAEASKSRGIVDLQSLRTAIPSLNFDRQTNAATPFLRGVGSQTGSLGNEPSVAVYVDNVYQSTGMGSLFDFNNIARVEVIKGPQGTLFGRNAVGGVVHVFTKDPSQEASVDADIGYANYDTFTGNFYANAPLSETLAANIAFHAQKRGDGWGKNLNTGGDTYRQSDYSVRGKVLWTPTDTTTMLVSLDYDKYKGDEGLTRTMIPGTFSNPFNGGASVGNPGFYNALNSLDAFNKVKTGGASMHIDQDLGGVSLVSITAYRELRSDLSFDSDALPRFTQQVSIHNHLDTFTQELQLKSDPSSKLQWIIGGFYYNTDAAYAPLSIVSGGGATLTTIRSRTTAKSIAAFGQATYELFPRFNLTLGARYTHDKRTIEGTTRNTVGALLVSNEDSATFNKFTYRVSADYHFNDDVMVYASANRGFKSGVFDLSGYTAPAVDPEVLDAYEIGFKSELLDRRLRFNISAFKYDYSNIQVTQIVLGTSRTLNGGKASIKGLEVEVTAIPVDNLTLTGGFSLLDGKYKDFRNGPHFNPTGSPNAATSCAIAPFLPTYPGGQTSVTAGCDLTGNDTIQTPPFSASFSATYTIPSSIGEFGLTGSFYYNDGYFYEPDNSVEQDNYTLLGAALSWKSVDETFTARLWGANLLGEKYFSAANSAALGKHYSAAPPRTYGVTLGVHF